MIMDNHGHHGNLRPIPNIQNGTQISRIAMIGHDLTYKYADDSKNVVL